MVSATRNRRACAGAGPAGKAHAGGDGAKQSRRRCRGRDDPSRCRRRRAALNDALEQGGHHIGGVGSNGVLGLRPRLFEQPTVAVGNGLGQERLHADAVVGKRREGAGDLHQRDFLRPERHRQKRPELLGEPELLGIRRHLLGHLIGKLSGGQLQRMAIARALAMAPDYMLFDEVTSALDPQLVGEVLDTLRMLSDEGMTMILVTHEIRFAREVSDRVAFLRNGIIHEIGTPQQVIDDPQRPETAAFLKPSH